jgi:hypothetical protein
VPSEKAVTHYTNAYELVVASRGGDDVSEMTGNYSSTNVARDSTPSRLLPIPIQIDRALGSSFIRIDDGDASTGTGIGKPSMLKRNRNGSALKRAETRLGNNMDSAIKAVQDALGMAHRALNAETIETLRPNLRAIRGGVVNVGEAKDIAVEVQKIGRMVPGASVTIVVMTTAQMHLLQAVCKAAPTAAKANVCTVFDLGPTCRCDVLLVSATYSLSSSVKNGRGVSVQRLPAIMAALAELPRLQSVVFLSGGIAAAWANSRPSSSFSARLGKALVQMTQQVVSTEDSAPAAAQWVLELHSTLKSTAQVEDGENDDWRLLCFPFKGESILAIAHKDSVVLCHCDLPRSGLQLEDRFCVLPQLVARWRWKTIHHVFSPSLATRKTICELSSALMRDMCGLGRLVQLRVAEVTSNQVSFEVVRKLDFLEVPADAVEGLALVRCADERLARGNPVQRNDARTDCVAAFSDSSQLRPGCEYFYELHDGGTRGETLQTVRVQMPSGAPDSATVIMELAPVVQSGSRSQIIVGVSVGTPSVHAIKDLTFNYDLKFREMNPDGSESEIFTSGGADEPAWKSMSSPILTANMTGPGLYGFVIEDLTPSRWYAVAVSVRNSVGQGPWNCAKLVMPEETTVEESDNGLDFIHEDDCSFGDATFSDDDCETPHTVDTEPATLQLHTDVSAGIISWEDDSWEDDSTNVFEIHTRPWDESAPAGKWIVVSKAYKKRVITARQLLRDDADTGKDGMQMEVRVRAFNTDKSGVWSYTSVPIRGFSSRGGYMSTIELKLCPSKRDLSIDMHVGDLMLGGIMKLSARVQQLDGEKGQKPSSRMTTRVVACLTIDFPDARNIRLPLLVQNDGMLLSFKRRAAKVSGEADCEQWQASVRPVITAPSKVDSSFWCQLYAAVTVGARSKLKLTYSAGVPGSVFHSFGDQIFAVQLQPYDPSVSGRLDLNPQFVLPKHALVIEAVRLMLNSWGSVENFNLGIVRDTLELFSEQCFTVQDTFVMCASATDSPNDMLIAEQLERKIAQLSAAGPSVDGFVEENDTSDGASEATGADLSTKALLGALLRGLKSEHRAELRPFPSIFHVKLSILEALRGMKDSQPHLSGIADYLQYTMFAGISMAGLDTCYAVDEGAADVGTGGRAAMTTRLPPLVAELIEKHSEQWDQHLSKLVRVSTDDTAGVPEHLQAPVLNMMLSVLLSGEVVSLNYGDDDERTGWSFRCSTADHVETIPCSSAFLGVGECQGSQPLLLVPVCVRHVGAAVTIGLKAGTNPFFNPDLCCDLLPCHAAGKFSQCSLQSWAVAALGDNAEVSPRVVLYVTSGDRASDRVAESPILDVLQHHQLWSRSSAVTAYGLMTAGMHADGERIGAVEEESLTSAPNFEKWRLANPCQVGDADASQRHAISKAIAGRSFVLRGPPGCGKTQTLANMVAALVAAGKTVCVVAKLPVALGVFAEKLRGMQHSSENGAAPSLQPLTTSFFTGKDGGQLRRGDDPKNAVTHDDRLTKWPVMRDLARFWSDDPTGTESAVRSLLREGWRLQPAQPPFLKRFQEQGIVGVQLVKAKHKPRFVCSLCGQVQASEAPFEKHMESHVSRKLWEASYAQRQAYEGGHWDGHETTSGISGIDEAVIQPQLHATAEVMQDADLKLHQLEEASWNSRHALHSNFESPKFRRRCGHTSDSVGAFACPGSGCCISEMSVFDMVASVANGAVQIAALKGRHLSAPDAESSDDLAFFALANQFSECKDCCDSVAGCCHAVLETVRAVKGASHTSVFSILSLATSQTSCEHGGVELQRSIYAGLHDVSASQSRLQLRCDLFELSLQLSFLRTVVEASGDQAGSAKTLAEDGWRMETHRRQACLASVTVGCEARLLAFLLAHPGATENLEAVFGTRGDHGDRTRRLIELLYPSLLSPHSATGEEDPALLLRLVLNMYPVFCFTPEECARHLPAALPGATSTESPVFDVVLFDEASQLPTYEALGCLGRASQCIIVGDDQQLPPRDGCSGLLDDALIASMSLVPLTWHYRSAFRSLIHVSNEMFYHGSLQCVPSANDFLTATGGGAGNAGLVRKEVGGPMQSNYVCRQEIETLINKRLTRLDPSLVNYDRVSYNASPQGFVNAEQAWRVLEELTKYMDQVRASGLPLSCGIITLNRPQRQLIQLLVGAASKRLGLQDAHNNLFTRADGEESDRDQPLFIQSIDQIQGDDRARSHCRFLLPPIHFILDSLTYAVPLFLKRQCDRTLGEEREMILFSMLLAPREAGKSHGKSAKSARAADDEEVAIFDMLEAAAEEAPADDAAAEDEPSPRGRVAPKVSAQRFQYSTIAHAHGDRLLNVGLSRAISAMKIFYHPRMVRRARPPAPACRNLRTSSGRPRCL